MAAKKGINGRLKGNRNEREVAGLIAVWWAQLEPDCQFVRTPLSGGWSSAQVRSHHKACGDLMTTAEQFPFVVEVKARENWSEINVLKGMRSPVWAWWRQSQTAAEEQGGPAIMWFRRRRMPWWVWLPADYVAAKYSVLGPPDVAYAPRKLLTTNIDYGRTAPALYFADRILDIHPKELTL